MSELFANSRVFVRYIGADAGVGVRYARYVKKNNNKTGNNRASSYADSLHQGNGSPFY